jgi:hypothetical protein
MFFDSTLNEIWFGKKPLLSHLILFGFDAFLHVPKEKRNKLEDKVVNYIFIRYNNGMKGYNIWDLFLRKKVYSRDVVIREVMGTSKSEGVQMEKETKNLVFEMKDDEHDSDESNESNEEVEWTTPFLRSSKQVRKLAKGIVHSISILHLCHIPLARSPSW